MCTIGSITCLFRDLHCISFDILYSSILKVAQNFNERPYFFVALMHLFEGKLLCIFLVILIHHIRNKFFLDNPPS